MNYSPSTVKGEGMLTFREERTANHVDEITQSWLNTSLRQGPNDAETFGWNAVGRTGHAHGTKVVLTHICYLQKRDLAVYHYIQMIKEHH